MKNAGVDKHITFRWVYFFILYYFDLHSSSFCVPFAIYLALNCCQSSNWECSNLILCPVCHAASPRLIMWFCITEQQGNTLQEKGQWYECRFEIGDCLEILKPCSWRALPSLPQNTHFLFICPPGLQCYLYSYIKNMESKLLLCISRKRESKVLCMCVYLLVYVCVFKGCVCQGPY